MSVLGSGLCQKKVAVYFEGLMNVFIALYC